MSRAETVQIKRKRRIRATLIDSRVQRMCTITGQPTDVYVDYNFSKTRGANTFGNGISTMDLYNN